MMNVIDAMECRVSISRMYDGANDALLRPMGTRFRLNTDNGKYVIL